MSGENYRRFEEIVTANCPMAEAGKPLSPDVDLVELGMDSLQIVSTMLQLEEAFEVTLPEEHMTLETFTTPVTFGRSSNWRWESEVAGSYERERSEPMTEASHKHVVECALTIPDRYRAFTRSTDDAWTAHRIPESVLLDLLDLGLPHQVSGSGPRFDDRDLVNLSLQLRLPSPQLRMLRFLGDCLSDNIGQRVVRTVRVAARCPDLDSDHVCEVHFAPSLMRYRTDR